MVRVCLLFRGYQSVVFILACISSLNVDNCLRHSHGYWVVVERGLDIGPIWKQPRDNLFIVWLNLPIRQRISYFVCHSSPLEYAENNWWIIDRLLWCLYIAGASCNNQWEISVAAHDIWKFQTKLRSIEVLALISAPGISIYNGPLPMITARPQAIYQGWYTLIVW